MSPTDSGTRISLEIANTAATFTPCLTINYIYFMERLMFLIHRNLHQLRKVTKKQRTKFLQILLWLYILHDF